MSHPATLAGDGRGGPSEHDSHPPLERPGIVLLYNETLDNQPREIYSISKGKRRREYSINLVEFPRQLATKISWML